VSAPLHDGVVHILSTPAQHQEGWYGSEGGASWQHVQLLEGFTVGAALIFLHEGRGGTTLCTWQLIGQRCLLTAGQTTSLPTHLVRSDALRDVRISLKIRGSSLLG